MGAEPRPAAWAPYTMSSWSLSSVSSHNGRVQKRASPPWGRRRAAAPGRAPRGGDHVVDQLGRVAGPGAVVQLGDLAEDEALLPGHDTRCTTAVAAAGGPGGEAVPRSEAEGRSCESPWQVGRS